MSAANATRILALVEQAKAALGAGVPGEPARLAAWLTERAPEFAPQIKALGGALALGALTRFAAAADPEAELARVADDVAMLEAIPPADARAGAAIVALLAGKSVPVPEFGPAVHPTPPGDSWVGATEVAAAPPPPPAPPPAAAAPPPAAAPASASASAPAAASAGQALEGLIQKLPPQLQNKWVLGAIAAAAVLLLLNQNEQPSAPPPPMPPQQQPRSGPQPGPTPQPGPQSPQGGGQLTINDFQLLVDPSTNQPPPQIAVREQQNALLYAFALPGNGGNPYLAVLSQDRAAPLWQRATLMVMAPGASQPGSVSVPGSFELLRQQNAAFRRLSITQWQSNDLNISGDLCIMAGRPGAQDVPPRQFSLCVLVNNCQAMVGCGVVP